MPASQQQEYRNTVTLHMVPRKNKGFQVLVKIRIMQITKYQEQAIIRIHLNSQIRSIKREHRQDFPETTENVISINPLEPKTINQVQEIIKLLHSSDNMMVMFIIALKLVDSRGKSDQFVFDNDAIIGSIIVQKSLSEIFCKLG